MLTLKIVFDCLSTNPAVVKNNMFKFATNPNEGDLLKGKELICKIECKFMNETIYWKTMFTFKELLFH